MRSSPPLAAKRETRQLLLQVPILFRVPSSFRVFVEPRDHYYVRCLPRNGRGIQNSARIGQAGYPGTELFVSNLRAIELQDNPAAANFSKLGR